MKKSLRLKKCTGVIVALVMMVSMFTGTLQPLGIPVAVAEHHSDVENSSFPVEFESAIPSEDLITISSVAELYDVESDWIVSEMGKGFSLSDIYQGLEAKRAGSNYQEFMDKKYPDRKLTPYEIHEQEMALLEQQLNKDQKKQMQQNSLSPSSSMMAAQSRGYDEVAIQRAKLKYDQAPYSIGDSTGGISMTDSSLTLRVTDLVLPGSNGLDFALTRVYNSTAGKDDIYFAEGEGGIYGNQKRISIDDERFLLGKGWSWDISYYNVNEKRLHIAGLGSFMRSDRTGNGLEGMPYPYIGFAETSSPPGGNTEIRYVLENFEEDTRQYFDGFGNLVEIRDGVGNRIVLTYSYMGRYGYPVLQTVMTVTADDQHRNYMTLDYQDSSNTVRASIGNRSVTYKKTKLPYTTNGTNRDVLSEVIDPLGRATKYTYTQYSRLPFNLFESYKDFTGTLRMLYWGWQDWIFLSAIEHPNKAITQYSTGMYQIYTGKYAVETIVTYSGMTHSYSSPTASESRTRTSFVDTSYYNKNSYGQDVTYNAFGVEGALETKYTFKRKYWGDNSPDTYYLLSKAIKPADSSASEKVSTYTYDESKRFPTPITLNEYSFGESGLLIGKPTRQTLDSFGLVSSITDANGATTTITNDVVSINNRIAPTRIVQPLNANDSLITTYTYDLNKGYLLTKVSKNKAGVLLEQINYEYDVNGNPIKVTIKGNGKDTVVRQTFSPSSKTFFLTGQSVQVTDHTGQSHTQTAQAVYDPLSGVQQSYTDGNMNTTSFTYDALGRMTSEKYPDGTQTKVTYNDALNQVTVTDPTGVMSSKIYSPIGELNSEVNVRGSTLYRYDSYGRLIRKLDYNNGSVSYQYDPWSRVSLEVFGIGANRYQYDDVNRVKSITDGSGNTVRESYDLFDRLTSKEEVKASGNVTLMKSAYDFAGNLISSTDANQNSTTYTYDALNRLLSVKDSLGQTTSYAYNLSGHMTSLQYADGQRMVYEHDELGRLIKQTDPLGQQEWFTYDNADQLTVYRDRMGQEQTYVYNNRGFEVQHITSDETVTYAYDAAGRRTAMTDGTGTTGYAYDANGDLATLTYPDGSALTYAYEERGLRTSQQFGSGNYQLGVEQSYLVPLPQVSSLKVKGTGNTELGSYTYSYRSNKSLSQFKTSNGLQQNYTYSGFDMTGLTQTRNENVFGNYGYSFDNNRNIVSKTDNAEASLYTYDALNRLKSSSVFNESYTYDARSNRKEMTSERQPDLDQAKYRYDGRNRLIEVDTEKGKVQYRYNGDGLLYERTGQGGATTRYYYDDRQLLVAEGTVGSNNQVSITAGYVYDASGELQARHIPGDSGLQTYWKNGHGDVTELKNAAGDTLNRYTYDVWGNPRVLEEQTPNVLRYAGEYWDEETGLQYLRSRWYDPNLGRFINEDTYEGDKVEPSSLNLYTYVENNPLIYTDPSGEAKRGEKNALEGLGSGSGSASGSAGMGRSSGGGLGGGGGAKGGSAGSKPKPSTSTSGQASQGTVKAVNVSESKMYQLGDHFNKHGRGMGYESKKAYDTAAKEFATKNQSNSKSSIVEGTWNGSGSLNGTTQRAITYDGRTVILDTKTGQVIDFFIGIEYKGINIVKLQ
ncbi:RHS repeat-associated core domain-containing protein [Paenibacillus sp. RRE4]|uniref:RHS repeat domain-containing protein n=1 Tax=Paenibacillus sp. RRE4 TaxID=2962587 RepID=UPI0028815715|nr:RHS repeat-associated core domain-containing protein [Paenibacillus sp. RRE4]MDT0124683.1 RHS repeat-associated core domain-containing protein [Paenibacillus sp. RRE4]